MEPLDAIIRLGSSLAEAARTHDLVAADLWFSDLLGHEGTEPVPGDALTAGRAYLARVDALLTGLLDAGARVALSSDHGNLENLSVKSHTQARVPFTGTGVNLGSPADVVGGGRVIAEWFGLDGVETAEF